MHKLWMLALVSMLAGCAGDAPTEEVPFDEPRTAQSAPNRGAPSARPAEAPPEAPAEADAQEPTWQRYNRSDTSILEAAGLGWGSSIGRGLHIFDVQAHDGTAEFWVNVTLSSGVDLADVQLYVLAPEDPCRPGRGLLFPAWFVEDDGRRTVSGSGVLSLEVPRELVAEHACEQGCVRAEEPTYDASCNTWQIGMRATYAVDLTWHAEVAQRLV